MLQNKINSLKRASFRLLLVPLLGLAGFSCQQQEQEQTNGHANMVALLDRVAQEFYIPDNKFANHVRLAYLDSLSRGVSGRARFDLDFQKATELLRAGEPRQAAQLFEQLLREVPQYQTTFNPAEQDMVDRIEGNIATAYLRTGEQENCLMHHTSASCIFPITQGGTHGSPEGSRKAIAHLTSILERNPQALQYRWLLNIAYMTVGEYPHQVPPQWLIPMPAEVPGTSVPRFEEVASSVGLDVIGISGGTIVEDFDNDGFLDVMMSSYGLRDQIRFFRNNGDGTFSDRTEAAGLTGIVNSLNMTQADFNNDGFLDVLVLRGAWHEKQGKQPNSLLRNNGDGTFTDVTQEVGLLSYYPTQTATWNDFDNDGWLDLFIGNEASDRQTAAPCELFLNQKGTFYNVAQAAGVEVNAYVKGVTSGDYDNDGRPDIYVSTLFGKNHLFRNMGMGKNGQLTFADVTDEAGLGKPMLSFPTWFWDFDNDGHLDIFVSGFKFSTKPSIGYQVAAEQLGLPSNTEKARLYRNNGDGTFTDVAEQIGLRKALYTMGGNFMDVDNDGFLDLYLGTGDPSFESLIPNKMFRNRGGTGFADITTSAGVGHLQKGHAVAIGDIDNDGDQDIYAVMGGAFEGDDYQNALFKNPHQEQTQGQRNNWISIQLEGRKNNRFGIGSRLVLTITENGKQRKIHRDVNSGGSFGASTLRAEIGLGQATQVDRLEIKWAGSNLVQVVEHVGANQFVKIKEGQAEPEKLPYRKLTLSGKKDMGGEMLPRVTKR